MIRLFAVAIFIMATTCMEAYSDYLNINNWLVAGSFVNGKSIDVHNFPFIDEVAASPVEGDTAGNIVWKKVSGRSSIDFLNQGFSAKTNCAAYSFTYLYAHEDELAVIYLGSDDGAKVWLNGINVWDKMAKRGMVENEDVIHVQLSKGWNRLLIKVDQSDGGWEMICNISAMSVKTSLNRPSKNELAKGKEIAITGVDPGKSEVDNMSLILHVNNYSTVNSGSLKFSLDGAEGNSLLKENIKSIQAATNAGIEIKRKYTDLSGYFSDPGIMFTLENGKEKSSINVPSEFLFNLLLTIAKEKIISDAATQKIVSDINYSIKLFDYNTGNFSSLSRKGLAFLAQNNISEVKPILKEISDDILKNAPDLSRDSICVIGHAHMDMNWLWPYSETKKMMHDNMRQVIAFMQQFPDFKMLQSQISLYKYIKKTDPPLFDEMKKYVKEGRLEPVGGMWTEGDCNMAGGEAICRTFLLGQRFLFDNFGKVAHVGWLPDDFGHISQFPQILSLSGCSYYYFTRCNPYSGTFWWIGPDSSRILCFSGNQYNNAITSDIKKDIDKLSPVKHRIFVPTGVGDHGGGPTLKDINTIHMLDSTPHYPSIKFTNAETFFKASSKEMDGRPTHQGEMQFIFEGCYTSVAEIKENTRRSEQSVYRTEMLSSLRWLSGETYPAADLKDMWETITFNQFHDILPGSAIYETYQDAVSDHKAVQKKANDIFQTDILHLADEVTFQTGKGQPVVVMNMQPKGKKVLVEAEIYSHEEPFTAMLSSWDDYYTFNHVSVKKGNKTATVLLRDAAGKVYTAQVTGGKLFPPGYITQIEFVVDQMPAGGYKTFYADASKPGISDQEIAENNGTFETDYFSVSFDMKTGNIIHLKDKRSGKEYVQSNGSLNQLQMWMEAPNGMNAWEIGDIKEIQNINTVESIVITERGPVRATLEVVKKWGHSKFIQRTYIYKNYPRIDFDLDVHWFEVGDGINAAPFLKTTFDLAIDNPDFECHVPFDVVKRPVNGQEVPAQQWVDITDGKDGIALMNKTKFGHSFDHNQLRLSLLRATYYPDIYPNIGVIHIQYSLFPHTGDWKNGVWNEADNFNIPVVATEPPSLALVKTHASRPEEDSLLIVSPSQVVMSGIKQSEDGGHLIIRLAEVNGKATMAIVTIPVEVKEASRVNIIELPQDKGEKPVVEGKKISILLKPHEIVTLSVKL